MDAGARRKTMSRSALSLFALACVAGAAWEPLGPFGATLGAMVSVTPDDSVVYVSTLGVDAFVYRSTDFGESWHRRGFIPERALCLAVDPADPNRLYLGAAQDLYRSTDGGASWVRDSLGYYVSVYDMAVHPGSSSNVFAVGASLEGEMEFFHSTNAGEDWIRTSPSTRSGALFCITVDPLDPDRVYVGGSYSDQGTAPAVFLTTDMGATFTQLASPGNDETQVMALSVNPADANVLCAGGISGIYRSTDRGGSWTESAPDGTCFDLAVTPADTGLVLAATIERVLLSTDGGTNWDSSDAGLSGTFYRGVGAGRTQATLLYAVNGLGFFRSTDGGATWTSANRGLDMFGRIAAFGIAPTDPATVYTSLATGYPPIPVYRTTDSGRSWTTQMTPMNCGNACGIAVSPSDPNTVFCLEGTVT